MTPTIVELLAATTLFVGSHFLLSRKGPRGALVERMGEMGFLSFYSILSIAALVWMSSAYARSSHLHLWAYHPWQAWTALVLMAFAILFLVGGVSIRNPTAMGQGSALGRDAVQGVLRITRNPVMWAIGLWSVAHLIPNGDLASLLFFGGIGVLALAGSAVLDAKVATNKPEAWAGFAEHTSNLPFAAIVSGRQSLGPAIAEIGPIRLAVALALVAGLAWGHAWLFGAAALPIG